MNRLKQWLKKWDWRAIIMLLVPPIVIAGVALWGILGLCGIVVYDAGLAMVIGLLGLVCVPLGHMITLR